MTYIDYLNAFHQWCESNTLPVNSRLLYMDLLHVFNRAGWPENVRVDNLRLALMAGVTTEKSAIRARDALVSAGFISYQKGKKGTPGKYALTEIHCNYYSVYDSENDSKIDSVSDSEIDSEIDSHIKTKTKTKNNTPLPPQPEETGFGPDLQAAFDSWLRYKKERKQPYKPEGLKKLISRIRNNAEKYGESAVVELIEDCMASNWQGIIFDRLSKTKGAVPKSSRDTIKTDADYESGDSFI